MRTKYEKDLAKAFWELSFLERGCRVYLRRRAAAEISSRGGDATESNINSWLYHLYKSYGKSWEKVIDFVGQVSD